MRASRLLLLTGGGVSPEQQLKNLFLGGRVGALWIVRPSTVWQESAQTTAGAVDSPVGYVADSTSNDRALTQSTDAARPTLKESGGAYYFESDGSNDVLVHASSQSLWKFLHDGTGGSVLARVSVAGGANQIFLGTTNSATGRGFLFQRNNSTQRPRLLIGNASATVIDISATSGTPWPINTFIVVGMTFSASDGARLYVNGAEVNSGAVGANSPSNGNSSHQLASAVGLTEVHRYSSILGIDRVLSASEILRASRNMAALAGASI